MRFTIEIAKSTALQLFQHMVWLPLALVVRSDVEVAAQQAVPAGIMQIINMVP